MYSTENQVFMNLQMYLFIFNIGEKSILLLDIYQIQYLYLIASIRFNKLIFIDMGHHFFFTCKPYSCTEPSH